MRRKSDVRTINLALQGGGAHGAFTWGVLDRLLQEPDIAFCWVSATSAGAVNAAAFGSGLARGGRSEARMTMRRVWDAVQRAGVPDLVRLNPFLSGLSRAAQASNMAAMLSPYDFNPLGLDPLRAVLTEHIDFAAIAERSELEFLIAATDIATGRARLFRRAEMSVEAVLASACLPTLHRAVDIDGRAYWDGGFSANPDLVTLAGESPCEDTLIVALNPSSFPGEPRSANHIAARVAEITFNQPFLRDIEMIVAAQDAHLGLIRRGRHSRVARLKRHRFHLISAEAYTAKIGSRSKLQPDGRLLAYLHDAGRDEGEAWLAANKDAIGRQSTIDLKAYAAAPSAPTDAIASGPLSDGSG